MRKTSVNTPKISTKAPESVQFIITNHCFLKCKFCDEPFDRKKSSDLVEKTGINIIERLKDWGVKKLTFSGGEPTMVSNLQKMLAKSKNLGFRTALATNGVRIALPNKHFPGQTMLDKLAPDIDILKLSLHGIGEKHDKIVGYKNAFKDVLTCLEKSLKYRKLCREITCVVTEDNKEDLLDILNNCIKYQVVQLTLSEVYPRGRGKNFKKGVSSSEIEKIRDKIYLKRHLELERAGISIIVRPAKPSCVLVYPNADIFVSHYNIESGLQYVGNLFNENIEKEWKKLPFRDYFIKSYYKINH